MVGPELPEHLFYLWGWFLEISAGRQMGGMSPNALSHQEIWAWSQLTQTALEYWELMAIRRLDGVWLKSVSEKTAVESTADEEQV